MEVVLFGHGAVGGVFENFLCLQDFLDILLEPVAVVHGLVAVTGDLEVAVVDLVPDGRHIGHLHVC